MKPYTEIKISKETRESLSICSKDALLYHLNDIKTGVNNLTVYANMPGNSGYNQLQNKIDALIHNLKKYS